MLRRLLSLFMILCLLCVEIPAVFAETVVEDVPVEEESIGEEEGETEYRTLVRGDRDGDDSAAIVTLQNRLVEMGYLRDSADGVFGQNTEKAIKELQRKQDVSNDFHKSSSFYFFFAALASDHCLETPQP